MMACVFLLSTSQVMALEDRNRKYKIVTMKEDHGHEKVKDKLKKRFKNAEKLEDGYQKNEGLCTGRCFSYLLIGGSILLLSAVIIFMVFRNFIVKSERDSYTNPQNDTEISSWYEYEY